MSFRMIVKTDSVRDGKPVSTKEYVRHVSEDDLPTRREAIRQRAQFGDVVNIKVVEEN